MESGEEIVEPMGNGVFNSDDENSEQEEDDSWFDELLSSKLSEVSEGSAVDGTQLEDSQVADFSEMERLVVLAASKGVPEHTRPVARPLQALEESQCMEISDEEENKAGQECQEKPCPNPGPAVSKPSTAEIKTEIASLTEKLEKLNLVLERAECLSLIGHSI